MTLATVGGDLRQSTRIVLIRDARDPVMVHQLRQPQRGMSWQAAVCRAAVSLGGDGAVVRIEGVVEKISEQRVTRPSTMPARLTHRRVGQSLYRGRQP
jgi:pyridoxine/pyridoxamine 5'-phosphate oxidase